MRKMRVMALVLSLSMLITAVPQVAFAEELAPVEAVVETSVDSELESISDADAETTDAITAEPELDESLDVTLEDDSEPALGSAEVSYFDVDENGVPSIKANVTLPSVIEASMLTGAKTIPAKLFEGKSIRYIEIPDTVTSIGNNAFANCRSLEEVVFVGTPSVTTIGDEAFKQCAALNGGGGDDYFTIPASVTTIGARCFEDCKALYAVSFNEASMLSTVGDAVFSGCTTLRNLEKFNKTRVTTITSKFFDGTLVGSDLRLPTTVTRICGNAFTNCSKIGELDLSNLIGSTLTLEPCCFMESGLTGIKLPKTYTVVTEGVFDGCNSLETLTLGNVDGTSVSTLSAGAIKNCKKLKTIVLNRSVDTIENYAIQACPALTKIKIYHDEEATNTKMTLPFDALPSYRGLVISGYDSAVEEWAGNHNEDGVIFETLHTSMSVEFNKEANANGNKTEASMTSGINVGNNITVKDTASTGYTLISLTHGVNPTAFIGNSKSFAVSTADLNSNNKIAINANYAVLTDLSNDDSQFSFVGAELEEFKKENNNTQKLTFDSSSLKKQVYIKYKDVYSNPWLWTFTSSNPNVVEISKTGIITTKAPTEETVTITASLCGRKVCYLKVNVKSARTFDHIGELTFDVNKNYDKSKTENDMPLVETSVGYVLTETSKGNTRNFGVSVAAYADAEEKEPINTAFTWKSSNTAAVKLVYDKTSSNDNTVKICGVGSAVVTVASVVNPAQKKYFIVRVVDKTPVVEDASIFINTKAGSTIFTLIQSYGGTVSADNYLKIYEKAGTEWKDRSNDFKVTKAGEPSNRADGGQQQLMELSVKSTSDYMKDSEKPIVLSNLYAKLLIDNEKYYYVALPKVTIVSKKPAPTIKVSGKINTFFTSASSVKNEAAIALNSPAGYELEKMPVLVGANDKDTAFGENFKLSLPSDAKAGDYSKLIITENKVTLNKDANGKVVTSGYLEIKYKGYDAVKLPITVPTSYVLPKYTMSKAVGSAHMLASGQEFEFQLMEVVNKKKVPVSLANVDKAVYAFDSSSYFDGMKPTIVNKPELGDFVKIKIEDNLPTDLKNVTARVVLSNKEWAENLTYTFKINLVKSNPAMKLGDKLIAINTATTTSNYMTFECASEFCDNATLSVGAFAPQKTNGNKKYHADFDKINVAFADGKIVATVDNDDLPKVYNAYTFKAPYRINYVGTSNYFEGNVTVKVQIYKTVPNVALKTGAVTLNNEFVGYEVAPGVAAEVATVKYSFANMPKTAADNVQFTTITNVTNAKNKIEYNTPASAPVKFTFANGEMKVNFRTSVSGNQKFQLGGVTIDGVAAKDIVVTVKTINKRPTITLTTKQSIDVLDKNSSIEYVLKVANYAGTVDASKLSIISEDSDASKNAYFIDVDPDDATTASHFMLDGADGAKVKLKINEDKRTSLVARAYRIKVVYKFGTKTVGAETIEKRSESRIVTTKPAQALPAAKVDKATVTLYGSDSAVGASIVVTPVEKKGAVTPTIASIGWAPNTKADIKDAFCNPATKVDGAYTYFDPATGKLIVKIKNPALIRKGQTYTLTYMVYYTNQLGGSKGVPVNVKVVIR